MTRLAAIVRVLHEREPLPSMVMLDAQTVKGARYSGDRRFESSHHVWLFRDPTRTGPAATNLVSHADRRPTRDWSSSLPRIGMRMGELTNGFESGRARHSTLQPPRAMQARGRVARRSV